MEILHTNFTLLAPIKWTFPPNEFFFAIFFFLDFKMAYFYCNAKPYAC